MSREEIALWLIVAQGFFVMFFEYHVWWMKYTDHRDKKKWREGKRRLVLRKMEAEVQKIEEGKSV